MAKSIKALDVIPFSLRASPLPSGCGHAHESTMSRMSEGPIVQASNRSANTDKIESPCFAWHPHAVDDDDDDDDDGIDDQDIV